MKFKVGQCVQFNAKFLEYVDKNADDCFQSKWIYAYIKYPTDAPRLKIMEVKKDLPKKELEYYNGLDYVEVFFNNGNSIVLDGNGYYANCVGFNDRKRTIYYWLDKAPIVFL